MVVQTLIVEHLSLTKSKRNLAVLEKTNKPLYNKDKQIEVVWCCNKTNIFIEECYILDFYSLLLNWSLREGTRGNGGKTSQVHCKLVSKRNENFRLTCGLFHCQGISANENRIVANCNLIKSCQGWKFFSQHEMWKRYLCLSISCSALYQRCKLFPTDIIYTLEVIKEEVQSEYFRCRRRSLTNFHGNLLNQQPLFYLGNATRKTKAI